MFHIQLEISMPILTIAFPAKFQIHARFAMTLMNVVERLREIQSDWKVKTHYILGKSNLSHARSVLVTEWYDQAANEDGFFFIDTDHTFTAEDILRVIGQEGDLNAGIYCNRGKEPTCFPENGVWAEKADNIPLKYAATGFLFFRKKALVQIHNWMKEIEKLDRVTISDIPGHVEQHTIPFFHSILEPPRDDGKIFWLGEDYSFSWRAIQAGLKIRGCITHTLGHEIPYVVFNDKPHRAPRIWHPSTFVVYAGNQCLEESHLTSLYSKLADLNITLFVFSANPTPFQNPRILTKRYEEFHSQDQFSFLLIWGKETFQTIAPIQMVKTLYVYIDDKTDSIPGNLLKAEQVFLPSYVHYNQYLQIFNKPGQLVITSPESIGNLLTVPTTN